MPPGLTPPLTADTEINHNGVITVIASFSLFLVLGSLGIRVYSAYSRRVRQLDDLTFAATVVSLSVSTNADPFRRLTNLDSCLGTGICGFCGDIFRLGKVKVAHR